MLAQRLFTGANTSRPNDLLQKAQGKVGSRKHMNAPATAEGKQLNDVILTIQHRGKTFLLKASQGRQLNNEIQTFTVR